MNKILISICCLFIAGNIFAATETKKAQAYFHYLNGASKENQRKFDEAIKEYKQALEFDPDSSEILSKLAYLYVQTNRMPEAVEDAQKAIQKNPSNKEAYRMLGQIYLEKVYTKDPSKEDLDKAIEQFREVYKLDPDDDTNLLTLGQLYAKVISRTKLLKCWPNTFKSILIRLQQLWRFPMLFSN